MVTVSNCKGVEMLFVAGSMLLVIGMWLIRRTVGNAGRHRA